ncbi:MAG: hypothetical protein IKO01_01935 [Kiritimatiellae bacterium]|nr:hypothetical protein [Kiritimatiellia bacterium]
MNKTISRTMSACARSVRRWGVLAAAASAVVLAVSAAAKPVIVHDPVRVAVKGEPLGLRATVRDAGGRVSGVAVFYASSRGMTPFRRDLTTTGAGIWFGTIPGHLIGPGSNLFYYVHADNLEGESTDTDWVTVRVIEPGMTAENMPSVQSVAQQSQRAASAAAAQPAPGRAGAPAEPEASASDRGKYWIPAAVILGGAAAVGGGIALANHGGGGGGGGGDGGGSGGGAVTNGNYGGNYSVCFEPADATATNAVTVCDSGLVNVYVDGTSVQVVGLWGGEVLYATLNGSAFTAVADLAARDGFPAAHLIVSGDAGSSSCSARVDGYSSDATRPGTFTGNLSTTRR